MTRAATGRTKKRRSAASRVQETELLIFEIKGWEPEYHFSVNGLQDGDGPYREVVLVKVHAVCRYPEKVFGREASFSLYAERDMFEPEELKHDREWRPKGIGYVDLPPANGHGYARLPHDSMPGLMTALTHKGFRYLTLHGTPLKRGSSTFNSIGFTNDEGLDEEDGSATA